jgi:hypothetical protein
VLGRFVRLAAYMSIFHGEVSLLQSRKAPNVRQCVCKAAFLFCTNAKYDTLPNLQTYHSVTSQSSSGPRTRMIVLLCGWPMMVSRVRAAEVVRCVARSPVPCEKRRCRRLTSASLWPCTCVLAYTRWDNETSWLLNDSVRLRRCTAQVVCSGSNQTQTATLCAYRG